MVMHYQLELCTREATHAFTCQPGTHKYSLFQAAYYRIATLVNRAKQKQVYPYVKLLDIKVNMDKAKTALIETTSGLTHALERRGKKTHKITFTPLLKKQMTIHNAIDFELIEALDQFDELFKQINLAKHAGVFSHVGDYFGMKALQTKEFYRLMTDILKGKVQHLPTITLEHYLLQDALYKKAALTWGDIKPQSLYNAIRLTSMPELAPKELKQIRHKLRQLSHQTHKEL